MTRVGIDGDRFLINGELTYKGCTFRGHRIEGLLLNSRMVQATFDDANLETRARWAYPDTGEWDADRNVKEFVEAMPVYREHGLLGITVNFQGGSPEGYSKEQPWLNTGFSPKGEILLPYQRRMRKVLAKAHELGMVVILGVFYFGQDEYLEDETAVRRALDNTVRWVLESGYQNVTIEMNNECNVKKYEHEILQPHRVHELIEQVKETSRGGRRLLVSTSYGGRTVPEENVVRTADYLLLHGNGVTDPKRIAEMVDQTREVAGYREMPILFNEDDHFEFDTDENNFMSAVSRGASWGFFDPGANDYEDGYQSPPVNWGLSTDRKQGFFDLVKQMSGG